MLVHAQLAFAAQALDIVDGDLAVPDEADIDLVHGQVAVIAVGRVCHDERGVPIAARPDHGIGARWEVEGLLVEIDALRGRDSEVEPVFVDDGAHGLPAVLDGAVLEAVAQHKLPDCGIDVLLRGGDGVGEVFRERRRDILAAPADRAELVLAQLALRERVGMAARVLVVDLRLGDIGEVVPGAPCAGLEIVSVGDDVGRCVPAQDGLAPARHGDDERGARVLVVFEDDVLHGETP